MGQNKKVSTTSDTQVEEDHLRGSTNSHRSKLILQLEIFSTFSHSTLSPPIIISPSRLQWCPVCHHRPSSQQQGVRRPNWALPQTFSFTFTTSPLTSNPPPWLLSFHPIHSSFLSHHYDCHLHTPILFGHLTPIPSSFVSHRLHLSFRVLC